MIPLKDTIPSRTVPYVNYALITVNVVIFLFQMALGRHLPVFLAAYGLVPAAVLHPGTGFIPRVLPFFTHMFLHGGFLHLGGNMLTLWIFGDNVEDRLGHGAYLLFYLSCGLAGSLAHFAANLHSVLPSIGASGAIAGVMGAYVLLYPRARVLTLVPIFFFIQLIEIPAFIFMGFWFIMQFFSGVASLGASTYQQGGVAWWAHIGGFLFGLSAGRLLTTLRPPRPRPWWEP